MNPTLYRCPKFAVVSIICPNIVTASVSADIEGPKSKLISELSERLCVVSGPIKISSPIFNNVLIVTFLFDELRLVKLGKQQFDR